MYIDAEVANIQVPLGPMTMKRIQIGVDNIDNIHSGGIYTFGLDLRPGPPTAPGQSASAVEKLKRALTLAVEGEIASNGYFNLTGTGKLWGIELAEIDIEFQPNSFAKVNAQIGIEAILFEGEDIEYELFGAYGGATLTFYFNESITGSLYAHVYVGDWVPVIGGWEFGPETISASFEGFEGSLHWDECRDWPVCDSWKVWEDCRTEYRCVRIIEFWYSFDFESGPEADFELFAATENEWEIPYNVPCNLAKGGAVQFMKNWRRLKKYSTLQPRSGSVRTASVMPLESKSHSFEVPVDVPAVIFRVQHEKPVDMMFYENMDATLHIPTPDGDLVPLTFIKALKKLFVRDNGKEIALMSQYSEAINEFSFVISNPPPGSYWLDLQDPENQLGHVTMELLAQNHSPQIEIKSIQETDVDGVYTVTWQDEDNDSNAEITFFLDLDREHINGIELPITVEEDEETDSILLDLRELSIMPGYYYLYARIDDGVVKKYDYSDTSVFIYNEDAPLGVTGIVANGHDRSIEVVWEASPETDITTYQVLWNHTGSETEFDRFKEIDPGVTSALIDDITNGQTHAITVVAVNESQWRSPIVDVIKVIPTKTLGLTPPQIVSTPETYVMVNDTYHYTPQISDLDIKAGKQTIDEFQWQLTEYPDGMTVQNNRTVTWSPPESQIGQHRIVLRVEETAHPDLFDEQELIITVRPSSNKVVNSIHYAFISLPEDLAFHSQLYTYHAALNVTNEQVSYELLESPEGMTIDENGFLEWSVPDDAQGHRVFLKAIVQIGNMKDEVDLDYYLDIKDIDTMNDILIPTAQPTPSQEPSPTIKPTPIPTLEPTMVPTMKPTI